MQFKNGKMNSTLDVTFTIIKQNKLQYNPDGSNTDGSFTVDDSNSFLSP